MSHQQYGYNIVTTLFAAKMSQPMPERKANVLSILLPYLPTYIPNLFNNGFCLLSQFRKLT